MMNTNRLSQVEQDPEQQLDFGSSEGAPSVSAKPLPHRRLLHLDFAVSIVLRALLAAVLVGLFVAMNYQGWLLIAQASVSDLELLRSGVIKPEQRLVTERVLMTLIGATAAEVAIGFAAVVHYIYPAERNQGSSAK